MTSMTQPRIRLVGTAAAASCSSPGSAWTKSRHAKPGYVSPSCVGLSPASYAAAVREKAAIVVGLPRGARGSCSELIDQVGRPGAAAARTSKPSQLQNGDHR
jgi:hypothetical protein